MGDTCKKSVKIKRESVGAGARRELNPLSPGDIQRQVQLLYTLVVTDLSRFYAGVDRYRCGGNGFVLDN